jgi:crossover junction endonuclease MUS81
MLEINIDYREKLLIDSIRKNKNEEELLEDINKKVKLSERLDNISFKTENLQLGDINFVLNNELILIIERKTIADLIASVKDGRYKEQKIRMKSSGVNMLYIIEDFYNIPTDKHNLDIYGMKIKQIFGLFFNAMFRDNIHFIFTKNVDDTYQKLEMLIKKYRFFLNKVDVIVKEKIVEKIVYVEKQEDIEEENDEVKQIIQTNDKNILNQLNETRQDILDYVSAIKTRKRDNKTGRACYLQQLCVIPGVSPHIANTICMNYPSMFDLCIGYNNIEPNKRAKMLSNIEVSIDNNKKRKLGKVLSERIYKTVMAIEE